MKKERSAWWEHLWSSK